MFKRLFKLMGSATKLLTTAISFMKILLKLKSKKKDTKEKTKS